jgi:hypothetical protein
MILLVGTSSKIIKKGEANNITCPYCHCNTTMNYCIHNKYAVITLIPLFPVEKYASIYCNTCNEEINLKDLDESTLSRLAAENNNLRSPLWMFFGSFALVCCLFYGLYSYFKSDTRTALLIKNPMIKDVYYTKDTKGYYYTFRIDNITKDSIYTTVNDYQVDEPYDIDDINVLENYSNQKSDFSKNELMKLYDSGKIISIKRQ